MNDQDVYNVILQRNLSYFGIDTTKQLRKASLIAAKSIIDFLQTRDSSELSIVIGDNYYAKYALAIAIGLDTLKFPVKIYCLTRTSKLRDQTAQLLLTEISELSAKYIKVFQDTKSEDILSCQSYLLALGEPGQQPSLRERESVKRITHFNPVKINLEYPVKGFSWDYSISFDYAKTSDAVVFNSGINASMIGVGPGELESVVLPNQKTHLSKNCRLTIITSSPEQYKHDKSKFASVEVLNPDLNLTVALEKLKSADTVLLDITSFYADLIIKAYKEVVPVFTNLDIKIDGKSVCVLRPSATVASYQVNGSKGTVEVKGSEIFTNVTKTARFNTGKSAVQLAMDISALAKHNHCWLACIGGCVW